jgi:hypothetical protein
MSVPSKVNLYLQPELYPITANQNKKIEAIMMVMLSFETFSFTV